MRMLYTAGGGGGGSIYVNSSALRDVVVIDGEGSQPGGIMHDIPEAVGLGDWDIVGGRVGEGGYTLNNSETGNGRHGAIRIFKPGFF